MTKLISSRRQFIHHAVAAAATGALLRARTPENKLIFAAEGREFTFDTGALRGSLHAAGQSRGLFPAFDCATGTALTKMFGLFSHYRLLDDTNRYGAAGWDWASEAMQLGDGAAEVRWTADAAHPFDMTVIYRWSSPNALDATTRVTARKELNRFEVFLASYFDGFPNTFVYAGRKPDFVGAPEAVGKWHMFPRDEAAVKVIQDGRWKRPPNPVEWTLRPELAAPLAVRRDPARGLAAVLMARPQDCFAVAMPHDEEYHRSVYFSLFGHDLKRGESAEAKSRLIIARDLSDELAVKLFDTFQKQS